MEAREATAPGPWDNINAVWTKDRGRTWDDLRPPPTAREAQGPDDKAQPGNRPDAVPEWAAADRADATGPQPAVTLFRPRGKMAIRCENKCTWCDEQCYQARNFRHGGHVGRCLCPKHTSMALAQTAKKYICSSTDTIKLRRDNDSYDSRRTQPAYQKWTDWSTRYWTPSHEETRTQGWYGRGWSSTQWRQEHTREGEQEPTEATGQAFNPKERDAQDQPDSSGQANASDKATDNRQDEAKPNRTDNQQCNLAQTGATDQSRATSTAERDDRASGQTPAQDKPDAPIPHQRGEGQGTAWEDDWCKGKRYYYAAEATDKAEREMNPWAKAGQTADPTVDEKADRQQQDIGSVTQPMVDGVAQSQRTDADAPGDRSNESEIKTANDATGKDQQVASTHPPRDGDRRHDEARPRQGVVTDTDEVRTAESESRSNQKGLLAVATPPHQLVPARQKPADKCNRTRSTDAGPHTAHRYPTLARRRPVPGPHTHRRIGEASNPGPHQHVMAQTHRGNTTDHVQPRCPRCGIRWQTNASRALQTDNTACMACGARGPKPDATEQSVRPTLLHFICTTCAWNSCPGCAGRIQSTPTDQPTGLCEADTPMTDQAKRRRSRTPEAVNRNNTPGPSTKLRRRAQTDHSRADDESYSDDSSTSEVPLPDSVRRILDFEQWVGSTSTSSSDEDTDEPPRSIPLLPYSEPDIPTPTGADFTDFSIQTRSPTSDSPTPQTQPARENGAGEETAAGNGAATPQGPPRAVGRALSPADDELTDGYITETDKDERGATGTAPLQCAQQQPGPRDLHEWTPPPKRHRTTPSTAQTAQATILDETDESERETEAAWVPAVRLAAHGPIPQGTMYATWPNEDPSPSTHGTGVASLTITHPSSVVPSNTAGGDTADTSHSNTAGQHAKPRAVTSSEREATTPQQHTTQDHDTPNDDLRTYASPTHDQHHTRVHPEGYSDTTRPGEKTAPPRPMPDADHQIRRGRLQATGGKKTTTPTTKPRRVRRVQDRPANTAQASSSHAPGEAAKTQQTQPRDRELPPRNKQQEARGEASTRNGHHQRQVDRDGQPHATEKKCTCGGSLNHRTIGRAQRCRNCGTPFRQRGAYRCEGDPTHAYCKECAADTSTPAGRTDPHTQTQRTQTSGDETRAAPTRGRGRTATEQTTHRRRVPATSRAGRQNTNGGAETSTQTPNMHTPTVRRTAMTQLPGSSDGQVAQNNDDATGCGDEELPPTDQCSTCAWAWPSNPTSTRHLARPAAPR